MATATYEPIATTTLGSSAASITFSSIAATWTDLRLVITATSATATPTPCFRFNGDSTSTYSGTELRGSGASAGSNRDTSITYMNWTTYDGLSTTTPNLLTVDIFSYAGSTYKTTLGTWSGDDNGAGYVTRYVGLWRNTAAITAVTIYGDNSFVLSFAAGTTATLYGIKAA